MYTTSLLAAALAMVSVYTTTSMAQTTNTTLSLIPTNVSASCSSFLNTLNNDTAIQACTAPLLSATQFYANATATAKNSTQSTTSSADTLTSSLSKLCAANAGCDSSLIRQRLSQFWTACDAEIRAEDSAVLPIYDVLYLLNPFHQAVCTRDDSNNYCVLNIASDTATENSTTTKRSLFEEDGQLRRRQIIASEASDSINGTTFSASNLAFLFLQTTSDKSVMCSSCAKNVMASYISFETSIPYAIGLANSDILGNQAALYNSMKETCGQSFTTAINTVAGTTAFATVSSGHALEHAGLLTMAVASIAAIALSL